MQIKSTPYFLLVSGVGLLFLAFFAEALPWKDEAISSLLGVSQVVKCGEYFDGVTTIVKT
jgi:hypothetical protein